MMDTVDRLLEFITQRSLIVVLVVLLLTAVIGYGAVGLGDETSLDQFETESDAATAQEYVDANFDGGNGNTTSVQVVIRYDDDRALEKESLEQTLALQQDLRDDPAVNDTLADEPFADVASVVATTAIAEDRAEDLEDRRDALADDREELNETSNRLADGINETLELQREYERLNASVQRGEIDEREYARESQRIQSEFERVEEEATDGLSELERSRYESLLSDARSIQAELVAVEREFRAGDLTEEERTARQAELRSELQEDVYGGIADRVLRSRIDDLEDRGEQLQEDAEDLQELDPTIQEQRDQLESMNESEVQDVVDDLLGGDADRRLRSFVPTDYDSEDGATDARTLIVRQSTEGQAEAGSASGTIIDSQLAIQDSVNERFGENGFAFGPGILTDEINRSNDDSLQLVLPFAFIFVLVVLVIAYRDPVDIVLGLAGIALVLIWTFGFMGWVGINFNQILIAVPVLLVGLSIDYAIHVLMRHREQRAENGDGVRPAMKTALAGLGIALTWVTVTAVIGFLSNLTSDVTPLQDFGVVSAFGIASTMFLFTTFVPAAKVGIDDFLEDYGWDRQKRAFGTGGGAFTTVLSFGRKAARRAPVAVLLVTLLLTGAGVYGAVQVDTSFNQEDFIAEDPPDWMKSLPGSMAPGDYSVKDNLEFVNERFIREDSSTQVLLPKSPPDEATITDPETLDRIDDGEAIAADQPVVQTFNDTGEADVQSPLSVMESVAAENDTFNETYRAADTDGDGVPDENVTAVYDGLFDAAPDRAEEVIYRNDDGEYVAARLLISIEGDATPGEASEATSTIADEIASDGTTSAVATGQLVVFNDVEDALFQTVIRSLIYTLVAVFVFLMIAYRITQGSATLGAVTLMPIALSVAWILGTMYLLDISFNFITGTITSLTIGLGVAYNIHMSERYQLELRRGKDVWEAIEQAVTGTGGALLGSAATTAGGFGVLAFAILPPLQDFGIITGITIIYAFLGSVFVLPSFLVLWTRYLGPSDRFPDADEPDVPADLSGPERTIEPAFVEPGGSCTVTIQVPGIEGRAMVGDAPPLQSLQIEEVDPEPVDATVVNGRIYVQWETDESTTGTVEYTGRIQHGTDTGQQSFDGEVAIHGGEVPIEGDETVEVVPDLFERIVAVGEISDEELQAAGRSLRDGQLTEMQYRRIVDRWLDGKGGSRSLEEGDDAGSLPAGDGQDADGDSDPAESPD